MCCNSTSSLKATLGINHGTSNGEQKDTMEKKTRELQNEDQGLVDSIKKLIEELPQ